MIKVGDWLKLHDDIAFADSEYSAGPIIPVDSQVIVTEVKEEGIVCEYSFPGPYDSDYPVTIEISNDEIDSLVSPLAH